MKAKSLTILVVAILLLLIGSFFIGGKENVVPLDEQALEQNEEIEETEWHGVFEEQEALTETDEEKKDALEESQNQDSSKQEEKIDKEQVEQPENDHKKEAPTSPPAEVAIQEQKEVDIEKINEAGKAEKEKIITEESKKGNKDQYLTDPVPEGKPNPVEPQDVAVDKDTVYTATLSVTAKTILNNMHLFNEDKLEVLPKDGVIFPETTVTFYKGESVFDVLQREMRNHGIHMESVWTPIYNSAYVAGINNIYEFDCGELSGWMYKVNGWFPNYGASRYQLQNNDKIEWVYTCDLGRDIGGFYSVVGDE